MRGIGLWHVDCSLQELENLINENDRRTPPEHELPVRPLEGNNAKDTLQEGSVEKDKVQDHRQSNGVDQDHVLPKRKCQE